MGKKDKPAKDPEQQKSSKSKSKKSSQQLQLPEHLEAQRNYVTCGPELNRHTSTATSANMYKAFGVDNTWSLQQFKEEFQLRVSSRDVSDMEFDMVGIDPSVANALRRILIAEVPTVAIEHVFVVDNTSIIADEVLSHRLGLVPLKLDPALLQFKAGEETANEKNTVVLKLNIHCKRLPNKQLIHEKVYASDLQWLPTGSEMPDETLCRFAGSQADMILDGVAPVVDNILLAKMRPGQCIELEAHCVKGVGKEHAKWSPVATAWYRLNPEVVCLRPITGELAQRIVAECPGLFVLEGAPPVCTAAVTSAREHEHLLEKVRRLSGEPEWAPYLQLRKRKDHAIFRIESTGVLPPEELFLQSLDLLAQKCDDLLSRLGP